MKRYLVIGLSVVLPIALVLQIGLWLTNISKGFFESILGMELAWWGVLASAGVTVIAIIALGILVTHSKLVRDVKKFVEKQVIDKTPLVRPVYNFGKEVVDTFASDLQGKNDLQVIEVDFGGYKLLGVLTDEENSLGFLLSAPSFMTGVVMKLPNYKKLDLKFVDAVKINASLGRVSGSLWR